MKIGNAPKLLFAVVETALSKPFQVFLRSLESTRGLHAIVLDEAHLFLSPELASFRPMFQKLPAVFRRYSAPLILLTGSLPPSDDRRLTAIFNMGMISTLRDPCRRDNISYRVDSQFKLDWRTPPSIASYIKRMTENTRRCQGRVLVFLPTKDLIRQIEKEAGSGFISISADNSRDEQAATLAAWGRDGTNLVLLATGVIGTGIDLPAVRFVLHCGMPQSFRDWFQQTGRAGRDHEESIALLNSTASPFSFNSHPEDAIDHQAMLAVVEQDDCRRIAIDGHVDGKASMCLAARLSLCDYCRAVAGQANGEGDEKLWDEVGEIDILAIDNIAQAQAVAPRLTGCIPTAQSLLHSSGLGLGKLISRVYSYFSLHS
jgi:superfamily II DNA helicase RecQ